VTDLIVSIEYTYIETGSVSFKIVIL